MVLAFGYLQCPSLSTASVTPGLQQLHEREGWRFAAGVEALVTADAKLQDLGAFEGIATAIERAGYLPCAAGRLSSPITLAFSGLYRPT